MYAWNSTLRRISKKRQAEIEAGTYKKPIRKPIRKISLATASRWESAKRKCTARFGRQCWICDEYNGEMHCHHFQHKRSESRALAFEQDNLCLLCTVCHNKAHASPESFNTVKEIILEKYPEIRRL